MLCVDGQNEIQSDITNRNQAYKNQKTFCCRVRKIIEIRIFRAEKRRSYVKADKVHTPQYPEQEMPANTVAFIVGKQKVLTGHVQYLKNNQFCFTHNQHSLLVSLFQLLSLQLVFLL